MTQNLETCAVQENSDVASGLEQIEKFLQFQLQTVENFKDGLHEEVFGVLMMVFRYPNQCDSPAAVLRSLSFA